MSQLTSLISESNPLTDTALEFFTHSKFEEANSISICIQRTHHTSNDVLLVTIDLRARLRHQRSLCYLRIIRLNQIIVCVKRNWVSSSNFNVSCDRLVSFNCESETYIQCSPKVLCLRRNYTDHLDKTVCY